MSGTRSQKSKAAPAKKASAPAAEAQTPFDELKPASWSGSDPAQLLIALEAVISAQPYHAPHGAKGTRETAVIKQLLDHRSAAFPMGIKATFAYVKTAVDQALVLYEDRLLHERKDSGHGDAADTTELDRLCGDVAQHIDIAGKAKEKKDAEALKEQRERAVMAELAARQLPMTMRAGGDNGNAHGVREKSMRRSATTKELIAMIAPDHGDEEKGPGPPLEGDPKAPESAFFQWGLRLTSSLGWVNNRFFLSKLYDKLSGKHRRSIFAVLISR